MMMMMMMMILMRKGKAGEKYLQKRKVLNLE